MIFRNCPATVLNGFGLAVKETSGLNQFFQPVKRRAGKLGGGPVVSK